VVANLSRLQREVKVLASKNAELHAQAQTLEQSKQQQAEALDALTSTVLCFL
jgi:hypothetical protein